MALRSDKPIKTKHEYSAAVAVDLRNFSMAFGRVA